MNDTDVEVRAADPLLLERAFVLSSMLSASGVRRTIEDVKRLRSSMDVVWWLDCTGHPAQAEDYSGDTDRWNWSTVNDALADTVLALPPGNEPSEPWSRHVTISIGTNHYIQSSHGLGGHLPASTVFAVLAQLESTGRLVRFLDGILAALCLLLVVVLTALRGHVDGLTFILIMLAACLRYGRRDEPATHTFLPIRRSQTSLGSCLLG